MGKGTDKCKRKTIEEARRVVSSLKVGEFYIWDDRMPMRPNFHDVFLVLEINKDCVEVQFMSDLSRSNLRKRFLAGRLLTGGGYDLYITNIDKAKASKICRDKVSKIEERLQSLFNLKKRYKKFGKKHILKAND